MKAGEGVAALTRSAEEITDTATRPMAMPRVVNRFHRVCSCTINLPSSAFTPLTHLVTRSLYESGQSGRYLRDLGPEEGRSVGKMTNS